MISVIINNENIFDGKIIITERADINHLKNVFRIQVGDVIRAVDGNYEYIIKVLDVEKKEITFEILEKNEDRFTNSIKVDAGIGILKNDKMDLTIQKLTEIGINKIIPLMTKRGVVKLNKKKDKWDVVVKEALKQCQAVKPTIIDEISNIKDLDFTEYDLVIVPYECEEDKTLKNLLRNLENRDVKKILYIIGPEGGFDTKEIEYLMSNGANIVTLGNRILRAETASIVVGGILVNEF